ncbi:hypothetical protein BDV96DRAFT_570159 [Lophiotrema nucula]|uniref:Uncharacterized protein n=1 Tax=Lophiotrema nucula TaxID=690887 RepID=A0A6A5ZHJ5_9PLEO|nr:hypothetical protein BDV96DRAFT_570159 [Lophiotrema nucula]
MGQMFCVTSLPLLATAAAALALILAAAVASLPLAIASTWSVTAGLAAPVTSTAAASAIACVHCQNALVQVKSKHVSPPPRGW